MIISEQWLKEWIDYDASTTALADVLTMLGLEANCIDTPNTKFSGVVVSEVMEVLPHPDADRLRVCQVDIGEQQLIQVVCGAKNVSEGLKVPLAKPDAVLPGDIKIAETELRGVTSLGMLCGANELGLTNYPDGLMVLPSDAPLGSDLWQYLKLDDHLIEIDLTPNRGDCLSVLGIARELAAVYQSKVNELPFSKSLPTIEDKQKVTVEAVQACPNYLGRTIKGVDASIATPLWILERLRRCGIKPVSVIVDITNYVMLELGQPMHAFDTAKLEQGIVVRMAHQGESVHLLNQADVKLDSDTLVIADEAKIIAIAGIMGDYHTSVSTSTQDIFLESAFFDPIYIAGKARQYGLHTESSHRFERGVDPSLQEKALKRVSNLLLDIVGGQAGEITKVHNSKYMPRKQAILLRESRILSVLGFEFKHADIVDILQRLNMEVVVVEDGWRIVPPSFRMDITVEADLIEELVRLYGYDNVPHIPVSNTLTIKPEYTQAFFSKSIKYSLVERGYQEVICYGFVASSLQALLAMAEAQIELSNPISSELDVMRTSLLPGLINTALHNIKRQQSRMQLFEIGAVFCQQAEEVLQRNMIAGLAWGNVHCENWDATQRNFDFFDVKADVEAILVKFNLSKFRFQAIEHATLHPGQTAGIYCDNQQVGIIGTLHPSIADKLKMKQAPVLFELDMEAISQPLTVQFKSVSEFPASRRDLAIVVAETISAQSIVDCVKKALPDDVLQDVIIFDIYSGKSLQLGLKSVALGLILQDFSRTLNDQEIDAITSKALKALHSELDAQLRE